MKEQITIVLGSKSDISKIEAGLELFKEFNIAYKLEVISAHRNPDKLREFCLKSQEEGTKVFIACAGLAAALPGFIASYVKVPVIGVALKGGLMDGLDALFSIVSTPKGLGLASTGVGKSAFINAIIFSLEILALQDSEYVLLLDKIKAKFKQ